MAAAGSEQISQRWVEGAERVCRRCGVKITNLAKQVGVVHNRVENGRIVETTIRCMDCRRGARPQA